MHVLSRIVYVFVLTRGRDRSTTLAPRVLANVPLCLRANNRAYRYFWRNPPRLGQVAHADFEVQVIMEDESDVMTLLHSYALEHEESEV